MGFRIWDFPPRLLLPIALLLLCGADWPRFRGPDGRGVAPDAKPPAQWSDKENVTWKTAMPGAGASSPIVVGDRVYVTCYSGYGLNDDEPGKLEDLTQHVVCVNLADGKILWQKDAKAKQPEREYRSYITLHGYASATPISDGQAVYAFFGRSGVLAYSRPTSGDPLVMAAQPTSARDARVGLRRLAGPLRQPRDPECLHRVRTRSSPWTRRPAKKSGGTGA